MHRRPLEGAVCFICDYGLIVLAVLLMAAFALARLLKEPPQGASVPPVPATATLPVVATTQPAQQTPVPATAVAPTTTPPALPQYILAVVAVNWEGSRASFEREAQAQTDFFIEKSGIGRYFDVQVVYLEAEMEGQNLGMDTVLDDVIQFGLQNQPADRYIGLTDGDLAPDGDRWVAGWTYGPDTLGVIIENGGISIAAHELGHTYGLCDEYNYSFWVEQNAAFPQGCPNPYPQTCPRNTNQVGECEGEPAQNGDSSIMASAGPGTGYSFNRESLAHLLRVFALLSQAEGTQ